MINKLKLHENGFVLTTFKRKRLRNIQLFNFPLNINKFIGLLIFISQFQIM